MTPHWYCIEWLTVSAVCCSLLEKPHIYYVPPSVQLHCGAVLISWQFKMYFLPMILFANSIPFFPRSNFTPCIPFPAKAAPLPQLPLFSFVRQIFLHHHHRQITLGDKSSQMQTSLGVTIVVVIKNFWPAVGSISDGSTALRHSATFRSSGR